MTFKTVIEKKNSTSSTSSKGSRKIVNNSNILKEITFRGYKSTRAQLTFLQGVFFLIASQSRDQIQDLIFFVIINFLNNRTNILIWRQAFASLQHGFLRSKENVVLYNFETPGSVWENVVSYNILTLVFIKPLFKADVLPQCYIGSSYAWQMLFAIWDVVDVITTEEDVISSYCL